MFLQERQEKILEYVNKHEKASTKELSQMFQISLVTIRSDINELDRKGLLLKTHGGAMSLLGKFDFETPSFVKDMINVDAKKKIGEAAASLISDNDVIILDSGTTTLQVANAITKKNITVITNDLKIALVLAEKGISVIMPGGTVVPNIYAVSGTDTEDFFRRIRANKLFLGVDAIDFDEGISNRTLRDVGVKKTMIDAAKKVIAVCDHSKCGKTVFAMLCKTDRLDMFITDELGSEDRKNLLLKGVEPIVTSEKIRKAPCGEENEEKDREES
jgi:DeoR family fructose operon transcriptional repressor